MQVTLTAKLKLLTTPSQVEQLRRTALAYRDALNHTSRVAFANGKLSQAVPLQKLVYRDLRTQLHLSAQLACNVPRQVAATYKGLWTKVQHNAEHRRKGFTKKRYQGLDKPPKYVALTTTFSYGYDYRFKSDQHVSLTTLEGRLVLPYAGYTPHLDAIKVGRQEEEERKARQRQERKPQNQTEAQEDAEQAHTIDAALLVDQLAADEDTAPPTEEPEGLTFGAAKLWRDPRTKQWYLLVSLLIPLPDCTPSDLSQTQGIDLGQRYLAVSTTLENQTQFIPGGPTVHQGEAYQRVRQRLQIKGTSGARWRLRQMTLKERRFKADVNHVTAKALVAPGRLIGLEDLTDIRDRTKQRGKKQRRKATKWAFVELKRFVAYKAALVGSQAITVDADYTSQQCPRCGYRSKANRPNKGLLFRCVQCGSEVHADLVGARQVCLRTFAVLHVWAATGQLSLAPDRSSDEAKAVRLQGYAELRWRVDPSPLLKQWGM